MKTLSILLVDDSSVFLDSVEEFLALHGQFRIVGRASNGQEAIQMNEQHKPTLVLMDVAMPVMNGLEATRQLKSSASAPKIFLMTGQDERAYAQVAQAVGADAFLPKSVLAEGLLSLLSPFVAKLDETP